MTQFAFSETHPLEIAVRECGLPFGVESRVRANELEDHYDIIVHSCAVFAKGIFSGRKVRFWQSDSHAFKNSVRSVVRNTYEQLVDLEVNQKWTLLGEMLGGAS